MQHAETKIESKIEIIEIERTGILCSMSWGSDNRALTAWHRKDRHLVFNVVGPRQSGAYGMVLPRFVQAALDQQPLTVHDDGRQVRCFAHVRDIVRAVLALMCTDTATGQVFNIGSDAPISILELAQRVIALTNSSSTIRHQSYSDAYDSDFEDIRRRVPDLSRLRATIDFAPCMNLDEIIHDVAAGRNPTCRPRR